eukprot:3715789-Prymnesium_polylepis.1
MHSGRWAQAPHLFRPNLAPKWKMLCRRVPALSTPGGFPQLERLIVSMADRDSGRRTHRDRATRAVRLSGTTACSVLGAPQPWMTARKIQL